MPKVSSAPTSSDHLAVAKASERRERQEVQQQQARTKGARVSERSKPDNPNTTAHPFATLTNGTGGSSVSAWKKKCRYDLQRIYSASSNGKELAKHLNAERVLIVSQRTFTQVSVIRTVAAAVISLGLPDGKGFYCFKMHDQQGIVGTLLLWPTYKHGVANEECGTGKQKESVSPGTASSEPLEFLVLNPPRFKEKQKAKTDSYRLRRKRASQNVNSSALHSIVEEVKVEVAFSPSTPEPTTSLAKTANHNSKSKDSDRRRVSGSIRSCVTAVGEFLPNKLYLPWATTFFTPSPSPQPQPGPSRPRSEPQDERSVSCPSIGRCDQW